MFKPYFLCSLIMLFSHSLWAGDAQTESDESIRAEIIQKNQMQLNDLYKRLDITPKQQADWDTFYKKQADQGLKAAEIFFRTRGFSDFDAAQRLRASAESKKAQAEDKKDFVRAFEPLYRKLSLTQKKILSDLYAFSPDSKRDISPELIASEKANLISENRKLLHELYQKLEITTAQEADWAALYKVTESRGSKTMDTFVSYQKHLEHAEGELLETLDRLADIHMAQAQDALDVAHAFEPLYKKMSEKQKKTVDELYKNWFRLFF